ncbi:MAG: glycosyltransferase, partial [Acetobacteraceae bacterium]
MERGQAALGVGDPTNALRWLDRACRLLPGDPTLTLSLATTCVGHDAARAAALFQSLAEQHGGREVWLGLAGTLRAVGDHSGAAAALARALSTHVVHPALADLSAAIGREAGAAGWCGMSGAEAVVVQLSAGDAAEMRIDDRAARRIVTSGEYGLGNGTAAARTISIRVQNRHLLGSPLDVTAIRRIEGFVQLSGDGGITGWAWQPGDPERDPVLTVSDETGRTIRLVATQPGVTQVALSRARRFSVSGRALAGLSGRLHVRGTDQHDLFGSPIDPRAEMDAAVLATEALARRCLAVSKRANRPRDIPVLAIPADIISPHRAQHNRRRQVDIVIPVHGAPSTSLACLDSVLATISPANRVIVVDDASPETALADALDTLRRQRRIRLIRHRSPVGFPGAANAGLRAVGRHDAVLLNSDTLVAPFWLQRLREAAYSAHDIGTVTPFSNNGTIVSYPGPAGANPVPDMTETARLARLAHQANAGGIIDLPVSVGFCMYVRRDCLDEVGLFRPDVFAQGYGEESDFCLRARHLGWRHVVATDVFVAHLGGQSFGGAGSALLRRNQSVLNRLHPGYDRLIAHWASSDPLREARRHFDQARWREAGRHFKESVILVTHAQGGGVERCVRQACVDHAAAGRRPVVLRPAAEGGIAGAVTVSDGAASEFPNLTYVLPGELGGLLRHLRSGHPQHIEVHHLLGHPPSVLEMIGRLGIPYDVHVHDHAWVCPRVILIGPNRRYCGEPAISGCEICVADGGSAFDEPISVAAFRQRAATLLAGARRVLVPSDDTAIRLRRYVPAISPLVVPHEDDGCLPAPFSSPRNRQRRICVIGAIGVAKGFEVLLACARDAAARGLPLEFVVVGHTIDDRRLMATGRVFVTGEFRAAEANELVRAQRADLGFLPSIWPETWCFALSDAWRAGLHVAAFDIGAQAERIRRTGRGFLVPLGLSAGAINNELLAASSQSVHELAASSASFPRRQFPQAAQTDE